MNIKSIQKDLKAQKLNGRIFTLGNLFIDQDILPEENRITELTGFTGSYAILFISTSKAYLFVDGRYELQAKKEVNTKQVEIVKLTEISFTDWLKQKYATLASSIVYNPWVLSLNVLYSLKTILPKTKFIPLEKPEKLLSSTRVKVIPHAKKFAGRSAKEKLSKFSQIIKKSGLDAFLVTDSANASWILNLRSTALPYTPIFRSYVLVEKTGAYKIFAENCDYTAALPFSKLAEILPKYEKLAADFSTTPAIIADFAPHIRHMRDETTISKAIKNPVELKGIRNAHLRDGVAVSKFIYWLSKNYKGKSETEVADKLLSFRKEEMNFYSESFATIAGFGSNAAIVHYHAPKEDSAKLKKNSLILIDSGGQYYDGTTDVTRTIALGTPTPEMIEKNTLVLKAHIALASATFPLNSRGNELDFITRQPLLKNGINFDHGTGHGVGCFSNVHEGPNRISITAKNQYYPYYAGMVTSIEPGYYKEKAFGIRIENLYYTKTAKNPKYMNFEVLTLIPLDKKLINKHMLSEDEIKWLNRYHRQTFLSLKKYLTKQELEWLKDACAPL